LDVFNLGGAFSPKSEEGYLDLRHTRQ
jgi:hypothetical protein